MKNLIILTSSFPFEGGEQFLETEIKHWQSTKFDNIYIIPNSSNGKLRSLPSRIKVITYKKNKKKIKYIFFSLINHIFYKEVSYIFKKYKFKGILKNIKTALKTTAATLKTKDNISISLLALRNEDNTIYCYWNDISFYAACLLKKEKKINHVISRAHGFDLYEERRSNNYMPLKRQLLNFSDKIYLLSENALIYYSNLYGITSDNLAVEKLGVELPVNTLDLKPLEKKIKFLSLSYCVSIKQIHIIMAAIHKFSILNPQLDIQWLHIGNGPLYKKLKEKGEELTSKQENLHIRFIGHLPNIEVKKKLDQDYFDVFINTSKSEGIPVSIMEAMSYGIPAIAPDVGELSYLVNNNNGHLLPAEFNIDDIIFGINKLYDNKDTPSYRKNAKIFIEKNFNSHINYPEFIKKIEILADINE